MKLEYHPATVSDLNRAIEYYDLRREGLGAECRAEIYRAIEKIAASPFRYRVTRGNIRRVFVRRFPFSILYSVTEDDRVRILVIRHHRQHQDFGMERT